MRAIRANRFVVGTEVMRIGGAAHRPSYGEIKRISAVRENGNFVLDNENDEWRPVSNNHAHRASSERFNKATVQIVDDALLEKVREERLMQELRRSLDVWSDVITRVVRCGDDEAVKALAGRLGKPPRTKT